MGSRTRRCGGQSCCLPNLARSEAAKLVSHTLQVLSLPAHRQDVMKQAWKAQVTDSRAFSVCYSWQVVDLAQWNGFCWQIGKLRPMSKSQTQETLKRKV